MTTLFCATGAADEVESFGGQLAKEAGKIESKVQKWDGTDVERDLWTETEVMLKERDSHLI